MRSCSKAYDPNRPSKLNFLYAVSDVAKKVSEEKPYFKMYSGGVYAVGAADPELPTHFIRVDKDRRPRRERKRMRRMARKLAVATV